MSDLLTVNEVLWHSDGIFEIQFDRNGLQFTPGDCVALFSEDLEESRPYSVASGLNEDVLRFVIRLMEGGKVSSFLAGRKIGDQVKMSPPFGWFRPGQPVEDAAPFVFIATGTGISPFLSHFRSRPENPPVQCLFGVRTLKDAVDREWLQTLCDLKICISREEHEGFHHGRVTDVLDDMPVAGDIHYYLCGLDNMIDHITDWLQERHVDITHIHRECFFNSSYSALE